MTRDFLAFELSADDRINATITASRMAATGYDQLPQWSQRDVTIAAIVGGDR